MPNSGIAGDQMPSTTPSEPHLIEPGVGSGASRLTSHTRAERLIPLLIFVFSIGVFFLIQVIFVASFFDRAKFPRFDFLVQAQHLTITEYIAVTFGALVLMVAGSYLPQLLKLKVPGVELEKAAVDQITTLGPIGISKAS